LSIVWEFVMWTNDIVVRKLDYIQEKVMADVDITLGLRYWGK